MSHVTLKGRNRQRLFTEFKSDATRLSTTGATLERSAIIDTCAELDLKIRAAAHRDGIQIIARGVSAGVTLPNQQYALATISDLVIAHNTIYSRGQLQPIFSSDGLIYNIKVNDNLLATQSAHHISLGGVMAGEFWRNIFLNNGRAKMAKVNLFPARIGGGVKMANGYRCVWVHEFRGRHGYGDVVGDDITDIRRTYTGKSGDVCLRDFDLALYRHIVESDGPALRQARAKGTAAYTRELQELAISLGRKE